MMDGLDWFERVCLVLLVAFLLMALVGVIGQAVTSL